MASYIEQLISYYKAVSIPTVSWLLAVSYTSSFLAVSSFLY